MRFLPFAALTLVATLTPASGQILFADHFETEAFGLNQMLDNWNITDGTIDVVGPGFVLNCFAGSKCIDLDGSTGNAGRMESKTLFSFDAGITYTLTYYLSGSQRSGSNTVSVSLGSAVQSHTLPASAPFAQFSLTLTPAAAEMGHIVFDHLDGDNVGLVLDNVELTGVPEPSSFLLVTAATGVAILQRLRTRRSA